MGLSARERFGFLIDLPFAVPDALRLWVSTRSAGDWG